MTVIATSDKDQVLSAVGSLLFLWADIEKALASAIATLRISEGLKSVHGIRRSLDVWSALATNANKDRAPCQDIRTTVVSGLICALEVRNLVCHSFDGWRAQLHPSSPPAELSFRRGGEQIGITLEKFKLMLEWLAKSIRAIRHVTLSSLERDPIRAKSLLNDFADFQEFSAGLYIKSSSRKGAN